MNIRQKAQAAWGQAQQEEKEAQERHARRNEERSIEWLHENFDGATLEDFSAQNIRIKFTMPHFRRKLHIRGECPRCYKEVWSMGIECWAELGEMLNGDFRTCAPLHKCVIADSGPDAADTLRDALIEFLDIEL